MKSYIVVWEIEIDANSEREAAEIALEIQRDPESNATRFCIRQVMPEVSIDLLQD